MIVKHLPDCGLRINAPVSSRHLPQAVKNTTDGEILGKLQTDSIVAGSRQSLLIDCLTELVYNFNRMPQCGSRPENIFRTKYSREYESENVEDPQ